MSAGTVPVLAPAPSLLVVHQELVPMVVSITDNGERLPHELPERYRYPRKMSLPCDEELHLALVVERTSVMARLGVDLL